MLGFWISKCVNAYFCTVYIKTPVRIISTLALLALVIILCHLSCSVGDIRLVHAAGDGLYWGPHWHICCSPPGSWNGGPHAGGPALPQLEGCPTHHRLHCYQGKPDETSVITIHSRGQFHHILDFINKINQNEPSKASFFCCARGLQMTTFNRLKVLNLKDKGQW